LYLSSKKNLILYVCWIIIQGLYINLWRLLKKH